MYNFDINKVPPTGYFLAYFDDSIVFEEYNIIGKNIVSKNSEKFDSNILHKVHFFNERIEYRVIFLDGQDKAIEVILNEDEEDQIEDYCLKEELIYLKDKYCIDEKQRIRVINRFAFDENDCIYLKNYRLAGLL